MDFCEMGGNGEGKTGRFLLNEGGKRMDFCEMGGNGEGKTGRFLRNEGENG